MIETQAGLLMAQLVSAFPANKATEETIEIYIEYLLPLPFERTQRAVTWLMLEATFFPSIAELVQAAGVTDDDARKQLLEAMRTRQPLVRDAVSPTGWAVGVAVLPPELIQVEQPALMGPVVSEEKRRSIVQKILALASGFGRDSA